MNTTRAVRRLSRGAASLVLGLVLCLTTYISTTEAREIAAANRAVENATLVANLTTDKPETATIAVMPAPLPSTVTAITGLPRHITENASQVTQLADDKYMVVKPQWIEIWFRDKTTQGWTLVDKIERSTILPATNASSTARVTPVRPSATGALSAAAAPLATAAGAALGSAVGSGLGSRFSGAGSPMPSLGSVSLPGFLSGTPSIMQPGVPSGPSTYMAPPGPPPYIGPSGMVVGPPMVGPHHPDRPMSGARTVPVDKPPEKPIRAGRRERERARDRRRQRRRGRERARRRKPESERARRRERERVRARSRVHERERERARLRERRRTLPYRPRSGGSRGNWPFGGRPRGTRTRGGRRRT